MRRAVLLLMVTALMVVTMAASAAPAFAGATVVSGPLGGHLVVTPSDVVNLRGPLGGHLHFKL